MTLATARALQNSAVPNNVSANGIFGPVPVQGRRLSVSAAWTGTPTGTFSLETCFDGVTWFAVPGSAAEFTANGQAQPAGSGSSAVWNWYNIPGTLIRIRYVSTSGAGTATLRAAFGD